MLRAGFDRIEITPPQDVTLQGYDFRFHKLPPGSAGVHDPLYARVLALHDGQAPAALVSLDLCIISTQLARQIRHAVAEAIEAPDDRVLVCCTHTHSGPKLDEPSIAYRVAALLPQAGEGAPAPGASESASPAQEYVQSLPGYVAQAAAAAAGLLYPVSVGVQQAPLGLAYDRRVAGEGGVSHAWNPQEQASLSPRPAGDPSCTALVLRQVGGPRQYLLWSIGAHPVVLGKTSRVVSADYPGLACRLLDEQTPHLRSMFLLGAAGDTHPWIATQEDPANLAPVAAAAASFVHLLTWGLRPGDVADPLAIATRTCTFGDCEVDLAAWRIGNVWIAASPTELFSGLAADLRRRVGGSGIVATCANGWTGYWPAPEAFDQGVYEVQSARSFGRGPEDSLRLIDELETLVQQVRGG